nr:hypothetical protein CFP56_55676 [Quercus suber]
MAHHSLLTYEAHVYHESNKHSRGKTRVLYFDHSVQTYSYGLELNQNFWVAAIAQQVNKLTEIVLILLSSQSYYSFNSH